MTVFLLSYLIQINDGQSMVEYALIILLIVIAAFGAVQLFGSNLGEYYNWIVSEFPASP